MNEFDHRPDEVLGDALRDALTAPDDPGFVRRVRDRIPQPIVGESWWEVLGEWARPGVAAAVAVLAAVTVWLAEARPADPTLAEETTVTPAETLSAGTLVSAAALPEFRWQLVLGEERVNE
ncbi:MAG: hypothetical protein HY700_20315 [Gemmatimonadetes bacterium]|nr:hypothetical protein [Gemmatimonadota bacterium]